MGSLHTRPFGGFPLYPLFDLIICRGADALSQNADIQIVSKNASYRHRCPLGARGLAKYRGVVGAAQLFIFQRRGNPQGVQLIGDALGALPLNLPLEDVPDDGSGIFVNHKLVAAGFILKEMVNIKSAVFISTSYQNKKFS